MADVQLVTTKLGIARLEDETFALLDTPFPHIGAVIEQTGSIKTLASCRVRGRTRPADAELLPPLGRPRAIWGVGLNYLSKARLTGRAVPTEPILYLGAPSAVAGPGAVVTVPALRTREPDYEGEIAVVVGRRLYQAEPEAVWPAVAAVTAANDMTARDVMRATQAPTLAKSFPGFNPLGASVSDPEDLPDRDRIRVRTWVNGELTQDDTSDGMIFPIPELLARLSWFAALEPGDVVLTGTPAGTGQDRGSFLADGDEIRVEIDSVLPLTTVVAAPAG
ncbi:fumarylacetoacetate hydrolase family protein [Rhizohabitans arisaemae]|uniref:fumarylacetoacetate hydrolase family protein n=1 Tax=Rhizohabitans arisaemae TaxID=2720610 RepID=UPI0024B25EFC|nr:fumarylacetoacetate hydrolase family protein [Rhizohabitans arisaemae]